MTVAATGMQGFEESYTFYRNMFLYCKIAALVFLVIAILLFFALKIPQVFDELTGRTARKAVAEMTGGQTPTAKRKTEKRSKEKKKMKKPETGTPPKQQVYRERIDTFGGTEAETTVLGAAEPDFVVVRSIVEIHTNEVIG